MASRFDNYDNSIVIDGFGAGIAGDPYDGISNLKNVNVTTIPGEASVGFATRGVIVAPQYAGVTVTSAGVSNLFSGTFSSGLESNQAVFFTNVGISGVSGTTIYYISSPSAGVGNIEFSLTKSYGGSSGISTGTSGTMTMYTVPFTLGPRGTLNKNYEVESPNFDFISPPIHWIADSNGLVWSDAVTTGSTTSWTYTGNVGNITNFGGTNDTSASGNGFIYFQSVGSTSGNGYDGWLFLWRQGQIDYLKVIQGGSNVAPTSLTWQYAWKSGLIAGQTFYDGQGGAFSHEAKNIPGNQIVFCDGFSMGLFNQSNINTPFNPTSGSSYAYFGGVNSYGGSAGTMSGYFLLPGDDVAQCCDYTGSYLYIGGQKNVIYPWDLVASSPINPLITLPERDIKSIVGVNQSIYIFAGNRGRIYISNGSQANLFAKIPDHISNSVQPYFAWGAVLYHLEQLYFGIFQSLGSSPTVISSNNLYGGVWGVDLGSQILYMQNTLSDNSSEGYCCALMSMNNAEIQGYGIYAGWFNPDMSTSGLDVSLATPYTGGQAVIESDLIPIGTYTKPRTVQQMEYKLSTPMVAGESITFNYRFFYGDTWKLIKTISYSATADSNYSGRFPATWGNSQWIQIQAVLTSTTNSPSYVRLKEVRLTGMVGPTLSQNQNLSI